MRKQTSENRERAREGRMSCARPRGKVAGLVEISGLLVVTVPSVPSAAALGGSSKSRQRGCRTNVFNDH